MHVASVQRDPRPVAEWLEQSGWRVALTEPAWGRQDNEGMDLKCVRLTEGVCTQKDQACFANGTYWCVTASAPISCLNGGKHSKCRNLPETVVKSTE